MSIPGFLAFLLVTAPPDVPSSVPSGREIKQRVIRSFRLSEDARENYSCTVREQADELNADGSVKRHRSKLKEQFYVNHIQIERTIARDGQELDAGDAKKEQQRVEKEVKKYSDKQEAEKQQAHNEKQADMFLRALAFSNGRRQERNGRSTLLYDLAGDPDFHPRKLEERFAAALTGYIFVDEESGTPVEMRFETVRDVKIGAGILANLHRGFWLQLSQQRQPDGVWITKRVAGSGDARAALFMRARFRFQEELEKCHLFSVETKQKIGGP